MKITDTLEQIIEKVEPYYAEGQKEIDITAVLKYIEDNTGEQIHSFIEQDEIMYEFEIGSRSARSIEIPNKPPLLYTEEELKHLLEILNNIENNE